MDGSVKARLAMWVGGAGIVGGSLLAGSTAPDSFCEAIPAAFLSLAGLTATLYGLLKEG